MADRRKTIFSLGKGRSLEDFQATENQRQQSLDDARRAQQQNLAQRQAESAQRSQEFAMQLMANKQAAQARRDFQAGESALSREFQGSQADLTRTQQGEQFARSASQRDVEATNRAAEAREMRLFRERESTLKGERYDKERADAAAALAAEGSRGDMATAQAIVSKYLKDLREGNMSPERLQELSGDMSISTPGVQKLLGELIGGSKVFERAIRSKHKSKPGPFKVGDPEAAERARLSRELRAVNDLRRAVGLAPLQPEPEPIPSTLPYGNLSVPGRPPEPTDLSGGTSSLPFGNLSAPRVKPDPGIDPRTGKLLRRDQMGPGAAQAERQAQQRKQLNEQQERVDRTVEELERRYMEQQREKAARAAEPFTLRSRAEQEKGYREALERLRSREREEDRGAEAYERQRRREEARGWELPPISMGVPSEGGAPAQAVAALQNGASAEAVVEQVVANASSYEEVVEMLSALLSHLPFADSNEGPAGFAMNPQTQQRLDPRYR